jgi:hypothetical protein
MRKNASQMQSKLRSVWDRVRDIGYKMSEEVVVLVQGMSVRDMLRQDIADDIPKMCMASPPTFVLSFGVIGWIAASIMGAISETLGALAHGVVGILILAQMVSCVVAILPLSRFWLPSWLVDVVGGFVNLGTLGARFLIGLTGIPFLGWIIAFYVWGYIILASIAQFLIFKPVYFIAGLFFGDKKYPDVKESRKFYGGLWEKYIEYLLAKDAESLEDDELFDLAHIYTELRDVPMGDRDAAMSRSAST